ncbi:hypothetical protein CLV90_1995 [Maribacter spongiicola]|uniref:Uncharacterized protein n=1 Tax=Maribacter spongiicola TaxID=1206753 RepID=A0A4R7K325_9FLAO|nr:DUF5694 domain-containing protein [Maribacter spongiicola]TDT44916.1 hypothetical protein CLV90_1995 [Maribacter spongiicola]
MKKLFFILLICFISCRNETSNKLIKTIDEHDSQKAGKIQVLNVGFFHFGTTSDANKVDFDENNLKEQKEIRQLSELLAAFKPTIICLEYTPEIDDKINEGYIKFLENPDKLDTEYGELSMVGYDVARMNSLEKVYGIDNYIGYNYSVGDFIENSPELINAIDPKTYLELTNNPLKEYPELEAKNKNFDNLSLLEKIKLTNNPVMLDYSLNTNADKLFYVGIDDNFVGADQAALFYQRNMRIFSNLNRIKMTVDDRVLIIMGSAHTAMLREFISRSPKFEMVNTLDYLK